jgi:hypothetical protein
MEKVNVTEVYFERVFNLGNYETCRIGLRATIGPKQQIDDVVSMLDDYTVALKNKKVKR